MCLTNGIISRKRRMYVMSNTVPNLSDGYKPTTVPQSLKVIQGGSDQMENSFIMSEQSLSTATSLKNKTVFNRISKSSRNHRPV